MTPSIHNIDEVIDIELHRAVSEKDPYLRHGTAGIAVFLIWLYFKTGEAKYRTQALDIMDKISNLISSNPPIEIYNGVIGISLLSLWLHSLGVITDDIDDILTSIDDYIYKKASVIIETYHNRYDHTVLDILLYIPLRLEYTKDLALTRIYQRLWLKLFNTLSANISLDFFIEKNPPELKSKLIMFLYICHKGSLLSAEIKHKVMLTLSELMNHCLSFFPRFSFNRLLLHQAVRHINESMELSREWKDYEDQLESSLSKPIALAQQMSANDMYLTHGIPCLIMFMKHSGIPISKELRELSISMILDSELFKMEYYDMEDRGYVGLDGILGTIMVLTELKYYS